MAVNFCARVGRRVSIRRKIRRIFDSIVANRALKLSTEDSLEGNTLISLESQADLAEDNIYSYVQENFPEFLRVLRKLTKEDQEILLSYYLLAKTQNSLAVIHKSTQTVCSFKIRMAVRTLGTFIMMGTPSPELMHKILVKTGMEDGLKTVPLSTVVNMYSQNRNFQKISEIHNLHRPDIRRAMSKASKQLLESKEPQENALGAYIHSLIDKANPAGPGYSKRKMQKQCHIYAKIPDICGSFRIKIEDPDFPQLFVSRANRK